MYRFLEQDPADCLPSAVEVYERGIALGGLSKALGAPGLRSGWLASRDPHVLDGATEQKDYTTICGSAPGELLSVMVLRQRARILEENRRVVRASIDAARARDIAFAPPRGGCTVLAQVGDGARALCDALFEETKVLALPSSVFEGADDAHIRLGLGRRNFVDALDAFVWRVRGRTS